MRGLTVRSGITSILNLVSDLISVDIHLGQVEANLILRTPTAFWIASPSQREVAQGDPGCVMKKSLSEASGTILSEQIDNLVQSC